MKSLVPGRPQTGRRLSVCRGAPRARVAHEPKPHKKLRPRRIAIRGYSSFDGTAEATSLRRTGAEVRRRHGIGRANMHHIVVRGCDFGFIGGGDQRRHGVRFGNGIEFWAAAHDNLVERCRLWEITTRR